MLTFSNTQQLTSAQDIQSTRAYWAARAGLEWALSAVVLNSTVCPSSPPTTVDTGATFTLSIGCTRSTYVEGTTTVAIFSFQSVASRGTPGSIGYVERSLSASYEVP
jgi:MSHA biogenesis protein MshP